MVVVAAQHQTSSEAVEVAVEFVDVAAVEESMQGAKDDAPVEGKPEA